MKYLKYFLLFVLIILLLGMTVDVGELLVFKMGNSPIDNQEPNLAQKLGFEKDAKLLVVNSDDAGAHPAFTNGAFEVMKAGIVKSTSIIVNDRNDDELKRIAEIIKIHPEWAVGIHLSLTNEYQQIHPWTPVLSREKVPSLYNEKGLCWEKAAEVTENVNPLEAEMEFEAQIQKALQAGIELSHIDSHMGTYYVDSKYPNVSKDGLRLAALRVAEKYHLPMTINTFDESCERVNFQVDQKGIIRPNTFFGVYELEELNEHLSYSGSAIKKWVVGRVVKSVFGFDLPYKNYEYVEEDAIVRMKIHQAAIVRLVKPGLNHFFMHAAWVHDSDSISIPTGSAYGSGVDEIIRKADLKVWSSDEMRSFLLDQQVRLVNYKEINAVFGSEN